MDVGGLQPSFTRTARDKIVGQIRQYLCHGIRGVHGQGISRQIDKDVKVIGVLLDRRLQAPKRGQIHAPLTPLYVMNGLHKDTTPTGTVLNFVLQRPVSLQ